jgi:hypothetical protein
MRPLCVSLTVLGLLASASAADARGRDAKHYTLPRYDETALEGLLAAPNYDTRSLDRIIEARTAPGGNLIDWTISENEVERSSLAEAGGAWRWPEGRTPGLYQSWAGPAEAAQAEVSFTHEWPALLSGSAGLYDFDLSPHASLGLSNAGRSAEAGAMIRFGQIGYQPKDRSGQVRRNLRRLGLTAADGRDFGAHGRWYLFAGASGQSIGLNLLRDPLNGDWRPGGLSADTTSGFVTTAQAGVAWRQGSAQASLGYVRRRIRIDAPHPELYDSSDDAVAFSLAVRPVIGPD